MIRPVAPTVIGLPVIETGPATPAPATADVLTMPAKDRPVRSLFVFKLAVLRLSNRATSPPPGVPGGLPRLQLVPTLQLVLVIPFHELSVATAVPARAGSNASARIAPAALA